MKYAEKTLANPCLFVYNKNRNPFYKIKIKNEEML